MITLLLLGALLAIGSAGASEPYALDIEILRPGFGWGSVPGVAYPHDLQPGELRLGALVQYARDPLVLFEAGSELGAMVGQRGTLNLGVGYDWERAQVGLDLPLVVQDGGDIAQTSAAGFGAGDPRFSVAVPLLRGPVAVAAIGAVLLPFGRQQAYLGEPEPRADAGAAYRLRSGPFELVGDGGLHLRKRAAWEDHLAVGSELWANTIVRVDLRPQRAALVVGALYRRGLGDRWGRAQNALSEAVSGAQLRTGRILVDVGVGRALAFGYGGTEFRTYVGISNLRRPRRELQPPPATVLVDLEPVSEAVVERIEEAAQLAWRPRELARISHREIEIREPIQFHFDTDEVLPISLPTLEAVGALLQDNPELLLLAVEGHASEEGSFRYNYDLSNRRAQAVLRELILVGVHPSRLTVRGMGEVAPVDLGGDEASLARNRRVVFHIVERADPLDPIPEPDRAVVPWSGGPLAGKEDQP